MNAIVYTSNTGFTARYAEMLGKQTGLPVYTLSDARRHLARGSEIIYMGWLFATSVKDYRKASKRFTVKCVVGVGLCPTGEMLREVRKAISLPIGTPLFTVQGGMKRDELRGINKFMIDMLIKMLKSKKNPTPEDVAQLELIEKGGDYVSEDNLAAALAWYASETKQDAQV